MYYNKEGKEITLEEWSKTYEYDDRVLYQEHVNGFFVSTVFLGLDHSFGDSDKPLIYETMVFIDGKWRDVFCERTPDTISATITHLKAVHWARLNDATTLEEN